MEIKDIYRHALMGMDISTLINRMAEYVGHSLVITDKGFRVMGYSTTYPVTDPVWEHIVEKGYCSFEFIQALKVLVPDYQKIKTSDVFLVECSQSQEQKFVSALLYEGNLLGFLIMLDNRNPVLEGQKAVLPELGEIIVQVLKRSQGFQRLFGNVLENALKELIETENVTRAEERVAVSGFEFPEKLICLVFFLQETESVNMEYVLHAIRENYRFIVCTASGGRVYGVMAEWKETFALAIPEALEKVIERIGIGPVASNVSEALRGLKLAARTCEITRQIKPEERVCYYKSVCFYNLLLSCGDRDILRCNLHPGLKLLKEFDMKNEGDLFETLHRFLENDCSVAKTAQELFIHRNTLNYRLGKIKELTGINYHNAQEKFVLMCGYRIWEIL